jgi:hypothetical protein
MSETDQTKLANEIANIVFNKIAGEWKLFMENMEAGQGNIANDIRMMRAWKEEEQKKMSDVVGRLEKKKAEIANIKDSIGFINEDIDCIKEMVKPETIKVIKEIKPSLDLVADLINYWKWENIRKWKNLKKVIEVVVGIIILIGSLVVAITFFMHAKGFVTYDIDNKHTYNIDEINSRISTGKPISPATRGGVQKPTNIVFSQAKDDSIKLEKMIMELDKKKQNE